MEKTAHLSIEKQTVELSVSRPTLGNDVIDIKPIAKTKHFTLDYGFATTASCNSEITFIDGNEGTLLYRGYPIDQLAEHCDFIDVIYLLHHGELPSQEKKETLNKQLKQQASLTPQLINCIKSFDRNSHPMAMLIALMGQLAAQDQHTTDLNDEKQRETSAISVMAKAPALVALCYRHTQGLEPIEANQNLGYAENFLYMLFGEEASPTVAHAMDRILTLHADHEQNASTATVRAVGATGSNLAASLAAGVAALWGPSHGGANEACLEMLNTIGSEDQIESYLAKAKDKQDPFRLMGFGHRVYKNYDPRAKVMHKICHDVLRDQNKTNDPLFKLAMSLEELALKDDYFISRKLYPNVDFYSGITQAALGISTNLFTAIFALARVTGWSAQWLEMMRDPQTRICRPRQCYTGKTTRNI